jgi:membrane protein DedA with SNARE-associated domain
MRKIWNFIKTVAKAIWYAFLNILVPGIAIIMFILGFQYDVHCGAENFNFLALLIYFVAWMILLYWAGNYYRFNKLENKKKVKILYDKNINRVVVFGDKYICDICEFEFEEYDSETCETQEIKPEFFKTYNN